MRKYTVIFAWFYTVLLLYAGESVTEDIRPHVKEKMRAKIIHAVKIGKPTSDFAKLVGEEPSYDSRKKTKESNDFLKEYLYDPEHFQTREGPGRLNYAVAFVIWPYYHEDPWSVCGIAWSRSGKLWCFFCELPHS